MFLKLFRIIRNQAFDNKILNIGAINEDSLDGSNSDQK